MKQQLSKNAKELAKHGRHGDDRLLHVSQAELDGLASLIPGGKLPKNPDTGLHEAFFFLPFLAGLAGAAAPAAAAAGTTAATLAATAAPAAAAAIPAATTAATALPAAASGIASLGAAAPTAASALAPAAATTAASALPGTASSLFGTGAIGSGAASGLVPSATLGGVPMGGIAAPAAASAAPTTSAVGTATKAASPLLSGATSPAITGPISTAGELAAGTTASGVPFKAGLSGLFSGMDSGKLLQYGALAAMMMPKGGGGGGDDDGDKKDVGAKKYDRGDAATPGNGGKNGGTTSEFDFFPRARYFAKGGLASLMPADKPSAAPSGGDDEQLIEQTVAALQGQTQNPDAVIQMFIDQFGPDAFRDLQAQVAQGAQGQGAPQQGSDGTSDSIPAYLSEGEYVVPAAAVSGIGNGSTEAGARKLDQMVQAHK